MTPEQIKFCLHTLRHDESPDVFLDIETTGGTEFYEWRVVQVSVGNGLTWIEGKQGTSAFIETQHIIAIATHPKVRSHDRTSD